jgi:hypothetical protein
MFTCSSNRTASIDSLLTRTGEGEGQVWNITFIRDFNDWEVEEELNFFTFIQSKTPTSDGPDVMRWKLRKLVIDNLMWRSGWETGDHLLIHCAIASELWYTVLHYIGVLWVFPNRIVNLLFGWHNYLGKHNSEVWNWVPLCLLWTIWHERNRQTLEDEECSNTKLTELFFLSFFLLSSGLGLYLRNFPC